MLLIQKDIQTYTHGAEAGVKIISHKVCQCKFALRRTYKQWTSLFKAGHMLAGEIAVGKKSATVRVAFHGFVIKSSEQFVHIYFHAHSFCKFLKHIYPCVQIRSTVVGMCHGNRVSCRSGNHVDFFIRFGKCLLQDDHGKYGSSCGNISGTPADTVCGNHTGSCVSLRRTHRDSSFQLSTYIQKLCAFLSKNSCILTCHQSFRHNIAKLPWETIRRNQFIELLNHLLVIVLRFTVDWEHTCRITDTKNSFSGEFPMHIGFQSGDIIDIFYMLLTVKDCLIQVCDAPSLRDIVMEKLCQLLRGFSCDVVSPGTERNHQLSLFIKRHIAMHHGTDTKRTYACKLHSIFFLNIFFHILVTALETFPDLLQAVCPDTIHILVLPFIGSGCDGLVLIVHQNCLDPCGTKLNTKSRAILKNCCFCLIYSHCKKPPILFAEIHAVPSQLILQIPDRCIAININRFNTHSCCFPVTLATEAIAFFHQSLDRKSRKLFQGAQITKVCYDSLIIFLLEEALKTDLDPCLDCYMLLKFLRVTSIQNHIVFIIIFFYQNINISLAYILNIFCDLINRISIDLPVFPGDG